MTAPDLKSQVSSLKSSFKVLFIGDVIGRPGRAALGKILPELKEQYRPQLVIANGENLAGGLGLTQGTAEELFSYGVDLFTTGNHIWDKKESLEYIDQEEKVLRPANYPQGAPGRGYTVVESEGSPPAAVLNLSGRVFMAPLDDPFVAANRIIPKLSEETNIIILDFHAEATAEKIAMGWYLDGQVSAVIGTHTHVQTADERILPDHTAYITDVGMTGPIDSVIGMDKDTVIRKFLTQMPARFEVPKGDVVVCAVIVDIEPIAGGAISIERFQRVVRR
ncbi:TIGR00282 family metallophosphoesterase [Candidatus Poribacteria bacterium]